MNIIQAVKADHREMRILCHQVIKSLPSGQIARENPFSQLVDLVKSHDLSEEAIVYEALLKQIESRELAMKGFEEHRLIRRLIDELLMLSTKDEKWPPKARLLTELLIQHIDSEELKLLPELKKHFSVAELNRMADGFRMAKRRLERSVGLRPPMGEASM